MSFNEPTRWFPWRRSLPSLQTPKPMDAIRANEYAMVVAMTAGAVSLFRTNSALVVSVVPGWRYSNSVTLAEASPGTQALPAREYSIRGSGPAATVIKRVNTWGGAGVAYLTQIEFYISEDNGDTYAPLLDEDRNYVLTLTYVTSGLTDRLSSTSWGHTP